ncbi:uncharacterized protein LOC110702991 [Chenopodium quinoa]|uniref:uncharacterized protein LOC110702991 n=1 Tax=Chenopodium quinoa TaxID=63459 RepID=UPI000B79577E|nr:uncharacterized protein LOC110702991 [Chenopodium quinoa]
MESTKINHTPMGTTTRLDQDPKGTRVDQTKYRGLCARFQSDPKESHLTAVKRILRYLKGTEDLCLFYPKSDSFDLRGYADADYAGDLVNRKSNVSAICISKDPVQHSKVKHIHVRHHFLKDNVEKGLIRLDFISTECQIVDILTKPLSRDKFEKMRVELGMLRLK